MLSLLASVAVAQAAPVPAIVPRPVSLVRNPGEFRIYPDTKIASPRELRSLATQLADYLRPATGFSFELTGRGGRNTISLGLDRRLSKLGSEGYRLEVKPDRVDIRAFDKAGLFYGMQSLRQALPSAIFRRAPISGVAWTAPCITVEDQPRFAWRGGMIDSSRHFFPKDGILKFIDTLALHKMNSFHWHLTDDNGWRIQIRRYPKLTDVGAWQPQTLPDYDPPKSPLHPVGGFYTQDDVREVVAYAKERFINVVPEIEMPGHGGAAIAAYPEIGTGGSNVFNLQDSTVKFMQDVLDEVMDMFPSRFIHVGGDEVDKTPWRTDAAVQARMKELGLKNEEEAQSWFIKQMDTYLTSKGRRLVGWDEILEGGLAPGATVMSWRGIGGGIAAAKAGHDVVMAPTSNTYLDYYQADPSIEPRAIGGFVPLEQVYAYEPIPASLTADEARHVLGVQGQLWSEYLPNIKHLEYMAWPRMAAISEIAWSPKDGKEYQDFLTRIPSDLERLKAADVNYRPLAAPFKDVVGTWSPDKVSETFAPLEWDVTKEVGQPGRYSLVFAYTGGGCRLDVRAAEMVVDGKTVSRDEHEGRAGGEHHGNLYTLDVPVIAPGAKVVVRAWVRADGGTDSNGVVRLSPAK